MHRPQPGGETDTEAGGFRQPLRLKPMNPKSDVTSAYEIENVPQWKRIGIKYRDWIIIGILAIVIIALSIRLAVVDSRSTPFPPAVTPSHDKNCSDSESHTGNFNSESTTGNYNPVESITGNYDSVSYNGKYVSGSGTENNRSSCIEGKSECVTYECLHSASETLAFMNKSVSPCDDFYEFVCGGSARPTVLLPDGDSSSSLTNIISARYQQQLNHVLREHDGPEDFRRPFKIARKLYKTCMDTATLEKDGVQPVLRLLRQLGKWPLFDDSWVESSFDWLGIISRVRKLGYTDGYFIGFEVDKKSKARPSNIIVLDQVKLSIPRDYLVRGMNHEKVKAYLTYMIDIAEALGINRAKAIPAFTEALELEIKLANITVSDDKRRKINPFDNRTSISVSELDVLYSMHMKWEEFINSLLPSEVNVNGDEDVLLLEPSYFSNVERVINSTSKRGQTNYVMWRLIASSVKYLSEDLRNRYKRFQEEIYPDYRRKPRSQECVDTVIEKMPISIGALYARTYMKDTAVKKTAMKIAHSVTTEFNEILKQATWMDKVNATARDKVADMSIYVAYPDEYLSDEKIDEYYTELDVPNSGELNGFVLTLTIFETKKSYGQRRDTVVKDDWTVRPFPTEVDVVYDSTENVLLVPSGILQEGYFDLARPQSMNYGALGALIGLEITRGFSNETRKGDDPNYAQAEKCIIDQYSSYKDDSSLVSLDGNKTREENIVDNAAVKEAHSAYTNREEKDSGEVKLPGLDYTSEQLFWIGAGSVWCTKYDRVASENDIATRVHTPAKYRVIGSMSNTDAFAKDFNCATESLMNPKKRCSLW